MERGTRTCFESIESAHEFLALLTEVVADAKKTIAIEMQVAPGEPQRRSDALKIAQYNLERLEVHMARSVRILNDLRSLRRLLFGERGQIASNPTPLVKTHGAQPTVYVPAPMADVAPRKAVLKPVAAA